VEHYVFTFWELIRTPFKSAEMVWAIVPLYFGWFVNELTEPKATFRTALHSGFGFLWSGAHWAYLSLYSRPFWTVKINLLNNLFAVSVIVTSLVIVLGLIGLMSGIRKKFPPGCSFLGHARFSNYFMICIFPVQANYLQWSWDYVAAILIFALPVWALMHFGLKPWRK
jgi:hypothetical protein